MYDERRSIDCSGAKVNDRSAKAGSFLEQRREEPKSFDKRGDSPTSCLRHPLFDALVGHGFLPRFRVNDFDKIAGSSVTADSPLVAPRRIQTAQNLLSAVAKNLVPRTGQVRASWCVDPSS